jgi:hypothetical protein
MTTEINIALPNPTLETDPHWQLFSDYLKCNGIVEEKSSAVRCYQCLDHEGNGYVNSSHLNHCLSLLHFEVNSPYAKLAEDIYGASPTEYNYGKSLKEIDNLFRLKAYRFTPCSIVFKGVFCEPFYAILNLESRKPGELVLFPGFLSTSVCKEKAESFCRGEGGVLLVISGLHLVDSIVPENSKVQTSPTADVPEQEILLNRNTCMRVCSIESHDSRNSKVVYMEAMGDNSGVNR